MTYVGFYILFVLNFMLLSCKGQVYPPSNQSSFDVTPGSTVRLKWTFDGSPSLASLVWSFTRRGDSKEEEIAVKLRTFPATISSSSLPRVAIENSTLVLKNVDKRYNGKYKFNVQVTGGNGEAEVELFIVEKPIVKLSCSSPVTLNEGDNFTCVCRGEGGVPAANVTWFKNDQKFGETQKLNNILTLDNVNGAANGTYNCEARSHTNDSFKDEKSIELRVKPNFKPIIKSFTSEPDPPINGKEVTLKCESDGLPEPDYTIKFENGSDASATKTYYIPVMGLGYEGKYKCIAKNIKGNDSDTLNLTGQEQEPATTQTSTAIQTTKTKITSPPGNNGTDTSTTGNGSGDPDIGLIIGIVIGVLALIVIVCVVVYCYKSKEKDRRNRGDVDPVAGNHYELDNEEPSPGDNAYDTVAPGGESGSKKKAPQKDSLPPVYAAVDKNNRQGNTLYASLDTDALKRESKKEPTNRTPQTEYASIDFANNPDVPKADLV